MKRDAAPAKPDPKTAGRRLEWPTLWHRDQLPMPWGDAKRLRRRPQPKLDATATEALEDEVRARLDGAEREP